MILFKKHNNSISLILVLFILLAVSCKEEKKQVKKEIKNSVVVLKKTQQSKKTDTIIPIDELIKDDAQKTLTVDKKYTLNDYISFDVNNKRYSFKIPVILKNKTFPYSPSQYSKTLKFAMIPNVLDTLQIIRGETNCYNCPSFIALYKQGKLLYYNYKKQETILVEDGSLTAILEKRAINKTQLVHLDVLAEEEFSENSYFNELLNARYITSSDLNLVKLPDIYLVKKQLDSLMQVNNLDTIANYYKAKLTKSNDFLKIDNFLSNSDAYSYYHSGVITKNSHVNIVLFIDSINIFYINANNAIYKTTWMSDFSECLLQHQSMLDDSVLSLVGNKYIWNDNPDDNFNLFNPNMTSGKYLVVYQVKFKDIDNYIYSDLATIYYNKSKETELFTNEAIAAAKLQELAIRTENDESTAQETEMLDDEAPYITASILKLAELPDIYSVKKQLDDDISNRKIAIDTLASLYDSKLIKPNNSIQIDNLLSNLFSNDDTTSYNHSGGITTNVHVDVKLTIESLNIYYINTQNDIYKVTWLTDYATKASLDEEPLDDSRVDLIDGKYVITDWKNEIEIDLFNPAMPSDTYLVIYQLKLKDRDIYIYSKANKISYTKP